MKSLENIVGKEAYWLPAFALFPTTISTISSLGFINLNTFNLQYKNALNLDYSKVCHLVISRTTQVNYGLHSKKNQEK